MLLNTIGYEGLQINEFFDLLIENGIQTIVDIRDNPISRKPGFSKNSLIKTSKDNNLNYIHLVALGCPKEIRNSYRNNNDWSLYTNRYLTYLRTQSKEIDNLINIVKNEICCLLCFEADYFYCHRRYVANTIKIRIDCDLTINHIRAQREEPVVWLKPLEDILVRQ